MKLVNLIPLKEIDFKNQDQFDAYIKQHELRPSTKVTIAGKVTTAGQAAKNSEPVKGSSVFGKDSGGSVFGKTGGASAKSDKTASASKEPTSDIDSLTSYEDFNKFFKANSDKLNKNDLAYIEDEIGALKYLESDYKKGKADRQEVEVAYVELQDLIKKALPKDTSKADVKSIVKGILKTADKEFAGTHKLKDITDDITVDTSDNDGKELQARIDKGEDGIYVQTGETEGTVVFKDGTQYQFSHVEDGPIPVTKVGGNASNAEKSKYDNTSYWKDDEYSDTQGYIDSDDEDSEEDDDYDEEGSDVRLTSDRLSKVEKALEDDLNLRGNGFETTRESSGGGGGWEGPMTIVSKDTDYNDEDNYISLSVGSPNNDGKFSIVFANSNGEPYFEPNYDALTGDIDLEPQQAYKVTKALMKMPEVQKLLKGEMNRKEFQPIYDKLKAKFSKGKTESTKLTSMIKR